MTSIDYIFIGILICSIGFGAYRGFVREIGALAVWLVALVIAVYFSPWVTTNLHLYIDDDSVRFGLSFFVLFIATFILMAWLAKQLAKIVYDSEYSTPDRVMGGVFGLVRGVMIIVVLLLIARTLHLHHQSWWQHSCLIAYFSDIADWLTHTFGMPISHYFTEQKINLTNTLRKN